VVHSQYDDRSWFQTARLRKLNCQDLPRVPHSQWPHPPIKPFNQSAHSIHFKITWATVSCRPAPPPHYPSSTGKYNLHFVRGMAGMTSSWTASPLAQLVKGALLSKCKAWPYNVSEDQYTYKFCQFYHKIQSNIILMFFNVVW